MLKMILFDLDGTLLPMDQDQFTGAYFKLMAKKMAPRGYEAKSLIDAIWAGTAAMVKNDGSVTNERVFWKKFAQILGDRVNDDYALFDEFYRVEFQGAQSVCGRNSAAAEAVKALKDAGYRVALATNPIFPYFATESRIGWAGLQVSDFELYTSYENCSFCKPNPAYYREVAEKLGVSPEECLMVGNDAVEDTAAEKAGMGVFLITDCLINKDGRDISAYPHGSFEDLVKYVLG